MAMQQPPIITPPIYEISRFDPLAPHENVNDFIAQVRALYDASFPIHYNDDFYDSFRTSTYLRKPLLTLSARRKPVIGSPSLPPDALAPREVMAAVSVTSSNAFASEDFVGSSKRMVYVLTIAVHEKYQRLGIASALIREVLRWGRESGADGAYLHVIAYNTPAIALYESLGFTQARLEKAFYSIDGAHHDAYLYVIYFPPSEVNAPTVEAEEEDVADGSSTIGDALDSLLSFFSSFALLPSSLFGGGGTTTTTATTSALADDDDDDGEEEEEEEEEHTVTTQ